MEPLNATVDKTLLSVFWFRRDLRLDDNAGLYHALRSGRQVLPVFIYDTDILDKLDDRTDKRVAFIHQSIAALAKELEGLGSSLFTGIGQPEEVFREILQKFPVAEVFTNRDYEPYALQRDARIAALLQHQGIVLSTYKDHVIFEQHEVQKDDGTPYTVFTPYSKKWKAKLTSFYYRSYPTLRYTERFYKTAPMPLPALADLNFRPAWQVLPNAVPTDETLQKYHNTRDYPALEHGTSRLGVHLRFGTISIRQLLARGQALNETFVNELIWRDFYHMILYHFPHVATGAFKPAYDRIPWRNNENEFMAWCEGRTGYPIVDAGMRQLNATGYMHNRVRMITASFLTKHLLIDWRWGEAYFASKLLDFDLAANNGGWQWAAGSGCDAAPYFRIFNPTTQTEKFDPDKQYIRKWLPEFDAGFPQVPIVEHVFARERCIKVYKAALGN